MSTNRTIDAANKILKVLVECAMKGTIITYKDLGKRVGEHYRTLRLPLGYIRDEICTKRGLPIINVIVVNKKTKMPGSNYLGGGTRHLVGTAYQMEFERLKKDVFSYKKWPDLLTALGIK